MGKLNITSIRECALLALLAFSVILAVALYYFSIAELLFTWLQPDELVAYDMYIAHELLTCTNNYYTQTTINRLSAGFSVCLMSAISDLFQSPYIGWVVARLIAYLIIPIAVMFSLRMLLNLPLIASIIAAFLITAIGFFLIMDQPFYLYGLDLSIYATFTAAFFGSLALLPYTQDNRRLFILFCVFYMVYLSSHEIALVIGGFFIPAYILMACPAPLKVVQNQFCS